MLIGLAVVAAAVLVAAGAYLSRGDRYRLYTDFFAGHCWDAMHSLALPSSSLRPVRVSGPAQGRDGLVEVRIDYHLDRALAGAVLDATCVYAPGEQRARSILIGDQAVDAETLGRINRELAQ